MINQSFLQLPHDQRPRVPPIVLHRLQQHYVGLHDQIDLFKLDDQIDVLLNLIVTCTCLSYDEVQEDYRQHEDEQKVHEPVDHVHLAVHDGRPADVNVSYRIPEHVYYVAEELLYIVVIIQVDDFLATALAFAGDGTLTLEHQVSDAECTDDQREHVDQNEEEDHEEAEVVDDLRDQVDEDRY